MSEARCVKLVLQCPLGVSSHAPTSLEAVVCFGTCSPTVEAQATTLFQMPSAPLFPQPKDKGTLEGALVVT